MPGRSRTRTLSEDFPWEVFPWDALCHPPLPPRGRLGPALLVICKHSKSRSHCCPEPDCTLLSRYVVWFTQSSGASLLPKWTPTYQMNQSTIVMPCNDSGRLDLELYGKFAMVDIDWSNAKAVWDSGTPMNCSEMLVEQVQYTLRACSSA